MEDHLHHSSIPLDQTVLKEKVEDKEKEEEEEEEKEEEDKKKYEYVTKSTHTYHWNSKKVI